MASSLGYALMSWSSAMAKHSKAKRNRKKNKAAAGAAGPDCQAGRKLTREMSTLATSSAISEFDYKQNGPNTTVQSNQTQTEDSECDRCAELSEEICHLIRQLSDVEVLQDDLKKKLSTTKTSLATAIERESKLRNANESMQLDEAQSRYELNQLKVELLQQLEEQQKSHDDRIKAVNESMKERECEWANRNASLQQELSQALQSALIDNQREDWSLSSLEKEIASLQTVIELRGGENRQLREENNKLKNKLEDHHWLETELGKAKHRLEELTLIVQNKMVSERELLELSEALQRDLVRCRTETIQLKQELENREYREKRALLQVKHSQNDLYNNNRNTIVTEHASISDKIRKLSSLQQIRDWAPDQDKVPNQSLDLRNQHQKASCGNDGTKKKITPDLVLDLQEKEESVAWRLQLEPPPTKSPTPRTPKQI